MILLDIRLQVGFIDATGHRETGCGGGGEKGQNGNAGTMLQGAPMPRRTLHRLAGLAGSPLHAAMAIVGGMRHASASRHCGGLCPFHGDA